MDAVAICTPIPTFPLIWGRSAIQPLWGDHPICHRLCRL